MEGTVYLGINSAILFVVIGESKKIFVEKWRKMLEIVPKELGVG